MIDITPYQQKLIYLQEWIDIRVDEWFLFYLIEYMNKSGFQTKIDTSMECGWPFELYCAYRQQQEANMKFINN